MIDATSSVLQIPASMRRASESSGDKKPWVNESALYGKRAGFVGKQRIGNSRQEFVFRVDQRRRQQIFRRLSVVGSIAGIRRLHHFRTPRTVGIRIDHGKNDPVTFSVFRQPGYSLRISIHSLRRQGTYRQDEFGGVRFERIVRLGCGKHGRQKRTKNNK